MLKREDLQSVFSFKLRGAYNRIANLSDTVASRGAVCASAGNHAQGVALAAKRRGIPAVIVMPQTTPQIKIQAVQDLGAEVVLHGDDYDSAFDRALTLARERNLVFVHPFDDPDVIAGQGTIGVEILRQTGGNVDAIFVPIGGGGLIAGIAVYVKYLYPNVRVIGVEPQEAASMYESLRAGKRVTLDRVGIFADGVAVKRVGEETFALCRTMLMRSCWSTRTRSAPPFRMCSRIRAPSSSPPARWRSPESRNTSLAKIARVNGLSRSTAAPT